MSLNLVYETAEIGYWRTKLNDVEEKTILNLAQQKSEENSVLATESFTFVKVPTRLLLQACQVAQIDPSAILYAAWSVLLQRYLRTDDVQFAASVPGREEVMITRISAASELGFDSLVRQVKQTLEEDRPFALTFAELQAVADSFYGAETPFNTIVTVGIRDAGERLSLKLHCDFAIHFSFAEHIEAEAVYHTKMSQALAVQRMLAHLENIVLTWLIYPGKSIGKIDFLTEDEKKQLADFNETSVPLEADTTIHRLFASQAKRTPERLAVIHKNERLTYRQLDQQSNRLARILKRRGIAKNSIVGVMAAPSVQMLVSVLAVLKSGAAYLPIDPNYPAERIRFILEDSQAKVLLVTQNERASRLEIEYDGDIVAVSDEIMNGEDPGPVDDAAGPADLAYVIYTSGSTGRPKGVMIEHRSLINLCEWHRTYFKVTEEDRASKYAGFGFDASVWEIFPYLISGAALYVVPEEIRLDAAELNAYFNRHRISIGFLPTQLCEQFMYMDNESLRVLLTGGDKLRTFRPNRYELYNCYGPTENTVVTSAHPVSGQTDNIPIGRPIHNAQVLILDACDQLQPVGVPGELCISGAGLARGYLNRKELTGEKFVPHPFAEGKLMYRTGDLARWREDGTIEFLGRIDHQVKIRGFRIEIGEIEQQLLQHAGIADVIVTAREDQAGSPYLCAYFAAEQPLSHGELAAFLGERLPDYMVPARFVQLESLPVNANGKVDRSALPEPASNAHSVPYAAPTNDTERQLAEIWQDILGISQFGINDRFFDLGGHSLQAAVLRGKMEQCFGVRLTIAEIFELTTIKAQALRIAEAEPSAATRPYIGKAAEREHYPLYPAQRRLFFIEQLDRAGTAYNAPVLLRIEGPVDPVRMERTFRQMIARHDIFRTSFHWADEDIVQTVHSEAPFAMVFAASNENGVPEKMGSFVQPFDLQQAPLFRAGLVSCSDNLHYLMLDFHHIIVDGVSMHVFYEEWTRLYQGEELPEPPVQFKDYALWLAEKESGPEDRKLAEYWSSQLAGDIPLLQLPTDRERPVVQSFKGETLSVRLDRDLMEKLQQLAATTDTTLYMILLAAYKTLLARYSNQQDVIVGVPVACRTHAELQSVIGMFVNTLPIRSFPESGKSFAAYLQEIRRRMLDAIEHQEYELEQLIGQLNIPRMPGRHPLFDTMFVMQNTGSQAMSIPGANVTVQPYFHPIAKYDLMVDVQEEAEALRIDFQYSTDLFEQRTIRRLANHFVRIVQGVVLSADRPLSAIELLTDAEVEEQVAGLNQTSSAYPADRTVHQWFEAQVRRTPDKLALVFEHASLTYRELNEQANRLACALRKRGITRGQVIGLMVDRSPEMIIGLLGILKAGAAYVPVDPEYPEDRIQYMLDNSRSRLLLTQTHLADKVAYDGEKWCLDTEAAYSEETGNPEPVNPSGDLLYVIYTSGTTGKPKGVMLEHRNMVNLLHYEYTQTNVDYSAKVLQFTTISFDVCSQEIWSALLAGGTLYLVSNETRRNPGKLLRVIEEQQINILFMPVSFLKFILNEKEYADRFPASVRHIITAGEQLIVPEKFRDYLRNNQVFLHNHYGPSETHVATAYTIDPNGPIPEIPPIGRPITNTRIYILNESMQLQPFGVPGELYIAGDCVGRGYYGNPELTGQRYLPDPFVSGERMYKTGDLARWAKDGTIEFLGRLDHQVKIRGFRIELGEVEHSLLDHPAIKETIVVAKEEAGGNKFLCAYFVATEPLPVKALRDHLALRLPDYMIPSYFIQLDNMPIAPTGKIDRRALPEPELNGLAGSGRDYVAPQTETEKRLAEVWQDILQIKAVGVHDNFFELGGHSLKAAVMVARLQKEFDIGINDVFECQTIAALALKVKPVTNHLKSKLEQLKAARRVQSTPSFDSEKAAYRLKNKRYEQLDWTAKNNYKDVLLTGATGYLGIHLLYEMLIRTSWNVHVIVRGQSEEEAAVRLRNKMAFYFEHGRIESFAERLFIYRGDLTLERFGLAEPAYESLAQSVDAIVHSAATVKHYGNYDYFEQHNIHSTERLLDFAVRHKTKDFHHISTLGVASGQIPGQSEAYFTEYDLDAGQQYENYYAKTKFEAEKRVSEARKRGVRSNIYRLGNIVFQSETGKFQENIAENAFYTMIQSFARLGTVPETEPDTDLTCVDDVSQAIVMLMEARPLVNETFHLYNPHYVSLHRLFAEGFPGRRMKSTSFDRFIDELAGKYGHESLQEAIDNIMLHYGWLEQNYVQTRYELASEKTETVLEALGFEWRKITDEQIKRMFIYCNNVNFVMFDKNLYFMT